MLRIFAWVVILGFFTAASAATARDREGETPSSETGNEPAAKSNDSAKPEVRKGEKITVESDLQELRTWCGLRPKRFMSCERV